MNERGARAGTSAEFALDVYGLRIRAAGAWDAPVEALRLDFAWFQTNGLDGAPDVEVLIERAPPDYGAFGDVAASFVTPRNVVYQQGDTTIVDYFGRALGVLDRGRGRLRIQGEDEHLVHEAAYLFCLSRIGEHLDARRLTRVHALGLAGAQGAVAVMLPAGGGKSTLALRALAEDGVKLLAEDTPLLDFGGRLHPFPLRVSVNAVDAERLPAGAVRRIERMEFHPKLALDLERFRDRIGARPQPLAHLVVGRRTLGAQGRLEPLRKSAALGPLLREAVVGLGVYQGMEFVFQHGWRDVGAKTGVAGARAAACIATLARTRVWRLTLGRDLESNWRALEQLLR